MKYRPSEKKQRRRGRKSFWTKAIVGRCLLGLLEEQGSLLLPCRTCWKIDNRSDYMMNEPQHRSSGAAVGISFLVQDRDVVSGKFSCVSSPRLVFTDLFDCESSCLCRLDLTLVCILEVFLKSRSKVHVV